MERSPEQIASALFAECGHAGLADVLDIIASRLRRGAEEDSQDDNASDNAIEAQDRAADYLDDAAVRLRRLDDALSAAESDE